MKLWPLQSLRFWAALAVVHHHAVTAAVELSGSYGISGSHGFNFIGTSGVDVFFVISGVVIARTAPGLTASQFAAKRLRRILPLYFLMTLPWVAFAAMAHQITWRNMISTFLLWPATDTVTVPILPVGWSLTFEMLFYACAALVLWRRWMLYPILAAFVSALTISSLHQNALLFFLGNPLSIEFLIGAALAYMPRVRPLVWAIPVGIVALILGVVLHWTPYSNFEGYDWNWMRLLVLGLPAAAIVAGTLQLDGKPSVTTYLGDASYALYLVHPLVLLLLPLTLHVIHVSLPADVITLIGMAACLLVGWRCYELFEKPIAAFFRRPAQAEIATV
jgi:exopolysaccharide production protein ExoZ